MSGCLLIAGILLCLTGFGAIIGVPMIILAVITMGLNSTSNSLKDVNKALEKSTNRMKEKSAQHNALKGPCPYCVHEVTCLPATPGLDCPACNQRIIVRNNSFLTLDDATDQTVVRPKLVPVNPAMSEEERKAARERSHKQQWKMLTIIFYILLGVINLLFCFIDLVFQPILSCLIFPLLVFSPLIIWKVRKKSSQRKYPIGIILTSLFGISILIYILKFSMM